MLRAANVVSFILFCYLVKVGTFGGGFEYCSGVGERARGYNLLVRLEAGGFYYSRSQSRYFFLTHQIPMGPMIGFAAILPSLWLLRQLGPSYREGFCGKCGYDLRATPGRCPECGSVPTGPTCPRVPRADNPPREGERDP